MQRSRKSGPIRKNLLTIFPDRGLKTEVRGSRKRGPSDCPGRGPFCNSLKGNVLFLMLLVSREGSVFILKNDNIKFITDVSVSLLTKPDWCYWFPLLRSCYLHYILCWNVYDAVVSFY